MPLTITFSARADAQLRSLYRYIAKEADAATAEEYLIRVVQRCHAIADVPRGGRPREELGRGLRSVPFRRRVTIFYRVKVEEIVIAAVFYRGQDVKRAFRRRR